MKNPRTPFLRGLTVQLLAFTVLPLTLLLLLIAFGSVSLHQRDMRALVGERDERAVQSAAAALASELHHRAAGISYLARLIELSGDISAVRATEDLASDYDGGIAYLDLEGNLISSTSSSVAWEQVAGKSISIAKLADPGPVFSSPFSDLRSPA